MINSFTGEYRFLSNFWSSHIWYGRYTFPTVEHAYQAAKSLDENYRYKIHNEALTPGEAKRMGRSAVLRSDWEDVKRMIMFHLVYQKFSKDDLNILLMRTGEQELVEGNIWGDTYWGVCNGKGENHLGKILMTIRSEFK